jgi:4-amino-4-deoxy-L-arabinose transferase-like glycosyltransferase
MKQDFKIYILIIALGAALFLPFLGSAHLFDWDEINFAEASREMLATGDSCRFASITNRFTKNLLCFFGYKPLR